MTLREILRRALLLSLPYLLPACASPSTSNQEVSLAEAQSTLAVKVSVYESVAGAPPFQKLVVEAAAVAESGCAVLHASVTANGVPLAGSGGGYQHSDGDSFFRGPGTPSDRCNPGYYTLDVHDARLLDAPIIEIHLADETATVVVRVDNLFKAPSAAFDVPLVNVWIAGETVSLALAEAFSDPERIRFFSLDDNREGIVNSHQFTRTAGVISFVVPDDWSGKGNLFVEAPRDVYGHPVWNRRVLDCENAASCAAARYAAADPQALAPDPLEIVDPDPVLTVTVRHNPSERSLAP